jgi:hypothetical protein
MDEWSRKMNEFIDRTVDETRMRRERRLACDCELRKENRIRKKIKIISANWKVPGS